MKLVGFLLLCGAGFGLGQLALSRAVQRRLCIEEGIELMRFIERELRYTRASPKHIFSEAVKAGIAPHLLEGCPAGFQELLLPDCFIPGEIGYFREAFGRLGHLPAEQCCKTLEQLISWLEERLEQQKEQCRQGAKLYRQLGFCGGLALSILLL